MNFHEFKNQFEKVPVEHYRHRFIQEPVVSVCVQTFRHADYIKECLESILAQQTTFPFEILIGEDASEDGTREICVEYAEKYPSTIRLFLHHEENNIIVAGSRTGRFNFTYNLFSAHGKYIALCEGDDYWTDPAKLQKQVNFLESNALFAGVFHEAQVINEPRKNMGGIYGKEAPEICTAEDTISIGSLFHTSSFVFKKSAITIPSWYEKIVSGDMALFSIVAGSGPLKKFPEIMSVYRKHPGGITSSSSVINSYHQKRIELIQYLDAYHGYKYKKKAEEVINYHTNELAHNKVPPKKKSLLMKWKAQLNLRKRIKKLFS